MFLAVGSGAYVAAIFLMVAHAFFKGQLFLGAGSVIHGMDDEQDLKKMGGLASFMPITAATFAFGWLAIAGVFPLAGFWAKGDVLSNAFERFPVLWAIGLVTALLTAYYMTRLYILAFTGDSRWRKAFAESRPGHAANSESHGQPHESPWVMTLPLVVLAVLSLLGGLLDLPWWHSGISSPLSWLDPVLGAHQHLPSGSVTARVLLSVADGVIAIAGLAAGWWLWRSTADQPAFEPQVLRRAWYVDDVYDFLIGRPSELFARAASVFDRRVIDGAVVGLASTVRRAGTGLRKVQTGFVRQYALGIVVGAVALLAFMLARAW